VKFPLDDGQGNGRESTRSGREHMAAEVRRIKVLSKFPKMRKYLPKIYYYDSYNGIAVMKYYPLMHEDCDIGAAVERLAQSLVRDLTGLRLGDIHSGNVTTDTGQSGGRPIFLDLGY
jgi:hypothetical protein